MADFEKVENADNLDPIEKIRQLAEQGLGRNRILREVPGVSEWQVRKVLAEAGPKPRTTTFPVKRHSNVIADLKQLKVEIPQTKAAPKDPGGIKTIVVFNDIHAPFHSEEDFTVACKILKYQSDIRVDLFAVAGDWGDFYTVSSFSKDPRRTNQIQDELIAQADVLGRAAEAAGNAKKIAIAGNHEERLQRFITNNAPALASLDQLKLENLLGLASMGYEFHPLYYLVDDIFLIKHGNSVAQEAGQTALKELDITGISGISGHTHRLGYVESTTWAEQIRGEPPRVWIENGCLCRGEDQSYLQGRPANWQQGFSVVRIHDGVIYPTLVRIHQGRALYDGKLFTHN